MDVNDYLIDHTSFDWQKLLASWAWLLDDEMEVQPWLMNRFGDLFFVDEVGVVLWLNINDGELSEVASNVDEFFELLESDEAVEDDDEGSEGAADWFLMGLVDDLVESGQKPGPDQCYGFKTLPVLGGEYDPSNVYLSSIEQYWAFCGNVHAQIDGLPDGAEVEIDIPER
jgi:hypothetical protein